ncbi:rRNA maturation RNase YbeY [Sulfitobacter sp. M57]|uniref:rRNA maturation RNase YbeY n=1 Tax=unclassified Sulfitobacter TaxID=196795 RepID=UPI0023E18958|nr:MULTISPECIES: rRNA maturation RNase YbeY [unclassified Sulfitobacter]MDF3415733.1 rRNA maturation RNase YbeY [Sulfitobacter sp. KE5]MDF3423213.1 rRNA maturation RNase YbeY [Sulfitobacter sp. KE43]MDF3434279.1 rRNA maturation RNase YbeY [Sulfitobacter sp. KE42]MDF3459688.1 rRNA maturation RNase YbeY [Sulfitobacter sp. S74]MDF3463817.1 rRNA maturation RNase YbeY [Sulfitobacter sp. Ks18]
MQNMDIDIEDPRWAALDIEALCQRAVATTLTYLGLPLEAEISILACDDARIAALNAEFRAKATPTNVLSWPSEERAAEVPGGTPMSPEPDPGGMIELGDIAISYDTCVAEAAAAGKETAHHITHLIIHGTLHLLGYDHETEQDAALMEGFEVEILGKLGLDDPYRES